MTIDLGVSEYFNGIDERRLSRRAFTRLTAAASIAALVQSGCRDLGSRATHIRFWNGFTGPDGVTMLGIIKQFNAMHDDVQVAMQRTEWGTYYNKLFVAGLGGRAPEVFVVQADSLERFVWGKLLEPIDAIFAGPDAIDENDIDANVLASARRGKVTYALPLDVHPMGVYYNKAMFAKAGIAKPPVTREEFFDACHKLKSGSGTSSVWGFVYEWLRINCYGLLRQWNGTIVSDDFQTVTIDSAESRAALEFAASLIGEHRVASPIENTAALIGFRQGRVGMVWGGTFLLNEMMKQTDLALGAAVMPQLGPRRATWAGSHQMCVRKGIGEREQKAAHAFMKYLSDHSLAWAAAGQVPVRKSLREGDAFKTMMVQSTFAEQIPFCEYMPSTPFTFEYQTEFDLACEAVLRGVKTPAEALTTAAARIRTAVARFDRGGGVA